MKPKKSFRKMKGKNLPPPVKRRLELERDNETKDNKRHAIPN